MTEPPSGERRDRVVSPPGDSSLSGVLERLIAIAARIAPERVRQSATLRLTVTLIFKGRARRRVAVVDGPLRGVRLELDLATEKAFWIGTHERLVQQVLAELTAPAALSFDVGAHIGFFSLLMARGSGARVIAVEPVTENAERIRRHALINSADIVVVEAAAAESVGTRLVDLGPTDGTAKLAGVAGPTWRHGSGGGTLSVDAVTLDQLVERYGQPTLIKIDVEGAEAEVLRGATKTLARFPAIVCELHGTAQRLEVEALLAGHGYDVASVGDDYLVARGR
jgi:FkbM family methyltransferase